MNSLRWLVFFKRFIHSTYFHRGIVFVALTIAVGASWFLLERVKPELEVPPVSVHSPDYYLENFITTAMNPDGTPKHQIKGDRMIHFIDENSTEITRPVMTIYDDQNPPWVIVSESGWLSGDGELMMLLGEVQMDRRGTTKIKPMHIDTYDLRVQPNEDYAETERSVFITSLKDNIKGIGMQTYFSKPIRFQLLAKVRGYYEIKQQ